MANIGDPRVEAWCEEFYTYVDQVNILLSAFFPLNIFYPQTWLNGAFPLEDWNHFDRIENNHMTNNICEGLNFRLISRFVS